MFSDLGSLRKLLGSGYILGEWLWLDWKLQPEELCVEGWPGGHGSLSQTGPGCGPPARQWGTVQGICTGHPIPEVTRASLKLVRVLSLRLWCG